MSDKEYENPEEILDSEEIINPEDIELEEDDFKVMKKKKIKFEDEQEEMEEFKPDEDIEEYKPLEE